MTTPSLNRTALASAVLVGLGAAPTVASAQSPGLDEITVTARRRAESFLDVPVTITAFDQQQIEAAGIERPQDFISLTPNVTLVETQNQGTSFIVVRGISQARNSEPSVAVIVDGVLMSNPAQFTQELFDVQQIEVLKGAQGAVYGRNAIGGAIVITTREPGDSFEGRYKLGYDSGPGVRFQVSGDGPVGDSDSLKFHAALSYYDTDGWIDNPYLGEEADPYQDISARGRMIWEPNDRLSLDGRVYLSKVETQALYFNIIGDVNDTSLPVRVNNPGMNDRDLSQASLRLDYDTGNGLFTSITSFDTIEEILTGDQFDFLPIDESLFHFLGNNVPDLPPIYGDWDWAQHQFLDVDTISQEVRFTSNADQPLRWIAGAYFIDTDRYISTGNIMDVGAGAFAVYRTPRGSAPPPEPAPGFENSQQLTFLADGQDNFAWAVFGEIAYDLNDRTEIAFALRYDEDERKQTTLTPTPFLPNIPGFPEGFTGEVRSNTWSESQPRVTFSFEATEDLTLFGGWSKGFRSGGFNQTGVGALAASLGIAGVNDQFDEEVAETLEFGLKTRLADGRANLNFSIFDTQSEGSYFFVFIPDNSTQNLGNLRDVELDGFEFDVTARATDNLDVFFGYGATNSKITAAADASWIGNEAPLVSENTINVGLQYRRPVGDRGLFFFARSDYQRIGDTYWDPQNSTVRDPVNLLDWRVGIEGEQWSLVGWQKNFNSVQYNAEFSPGGFVFKGKPRRWGIEYSRHF